MLETENIEIDEDAADEVWSVAAALFPEASGPAKADDVQHASPQANKLPIDMPGEKKCESPENEELANEDYAEVAHPGLEDMVYNEETGEYDHPDENSFSLE